MCGLNHPWDNRFCGGQNGHCPFFAYLLQRGKGTEQRAEQIYPILMKRNPILMKRKPIWMREISKREKRILREPLRGMGQKDLRADLSVLSDTLD